MESRLNKMYSKLKTYAIHYVYTLFGTACPIKPIQKWICMVHAFSSNDYLTTLFFVLLISNGMHM